ncbi:MAG TPA: hemolysin III family protein [Pirellulaceae bacterium]|nr:hemolysin III family protein [Pirellulaceae bacterium]
MMTESSTPAAPGPSLGEEIANSVSHGAGLLVALVAGPLLIARAVSHGRPWGAFSASVFAAAIVAMYLASTLYHALPQGRAKRIFRTLEHSAIFLLIAGTYTPFTLVALRGIWGWALFGLVWTLAALGILLKSVATTRYRWLPGVLYLGLAWIIVVALRPLSLHVPHAGLMWLLAGGIAYTIGVGFFAARRIPYCHFVWHLFVLAGTTCHFVAVWRYVV